MANYVVTTRNADGSLVDRAYTANDRADLFKKLAADGVTAVRVREGILGKKPRKSAASGAPSKGRGLIAAAIVILGVGAAIWFLMPGGEKAHVKTEKKPAPKAEADKAKKDAPKPPKAKPAEVKKEVKKPKPSVETNFVNGVWYDDKGRPHYKPARVIKAGANTIINGKPWVPPRQIFHRVSEVELDRVLSAPPGERIIGDTNWALFDKDIRESVGVSVAIDPEDTDEEIARKEAVNAAKKELAKAIAEGESPSAILRETRDAYNKLADLYDNLNRSLYEIKTDGQTTEEDFELAVKAANKMLEENRIYSKRFRTPAEIRAKAEEARQRKLLQQKRQK